MTALYVDVSHHDRNRRGGPLDFAAVAAAGLGGVMCMRATYGDPAGFHPSSPFFAETQANARAAGFVARGGYHNLIHGDAASIARQVDYFRSTLDAAEATWAMADIEPYQELVTNGLWPRWDDVRRFHDRWYTVDSRVMAWYIPKWFWNPDPDGGPSLGQPDLRGLHGPLVQSHYAGGDGTAQQIYTAAGGDGGTGWDDAYGGRLPDIWQYTSTGNVPGLTSLTDVNAYCGTIDQLIALLGGTEPDMLTADQDQMLINVHTWLLEYLRGQSTPSSIHGVPYWPNLRLAELAAAAAGDATRDAATTAAIEALTDLVRAGGGDVDSAAILERIDQRAAESAGREQAHQDELAAVREQLAAIEAERDQLRHRLADAAQAEADALAADEPAEG